MKDRRQVVGSLAAACLLAGCGAGDSQVFVQFPEGASEDTSVLVIEDGRHSAVVGVPHTLTTPGRDLALQLIDFGSSCPDIVSKAFHASLGPPAWGSPAVLTVDVDPLLAPVAAWRARLDGGALSMPWEVVNDPEGAASTLLGVTPSTPTQCFAATETPRLHVVFSLEGLLAPFDAPDGLWFVFTDGRLSKVDTEGVVTMYDVELTGISAVATDGNLIYLLSSGQVYEVSVSSPGPARPMGNVLDPPLDAAALVSRDLAIGRGVGGEPQVAFASSAGAYLLDTDGRWTELLAGPAGAVAWLGPGRWLIAESDAPALVDVDNGSTTRREIRTDFPLSLIRVFDDDLVLAANSALELVRWTDGRVDYLETAALEGQRFGPLLAQTRRGILSRNPAASDALRLYSRDAGFCETVPLSANNARAVHEAEWGLMVATLSTPLAAELTVRVISFEELEANCSNPLP